MQKFHSKTVHFLFKKKKIIIKMSKENEPYEKSLSNCIQYGTCFTEQEDLASNVPPLSGLTTGITFSQ